MEDQQGHPFTEGIKEMRNNLEGVEKIRKIFAQLYGVILRNDQDRIDRDEPNLRTREVSHLELGTSERGSPQHGLLSERFILEGTKDLDTAH